MVHQSNPESQRRHVISWDLIPLTPAVVLKDGIRRIRIALERQPVSSRSDLLFRSETLELSGKWQEIDSSTSRLALSLTNTSRFSVRLTRLLFASENGLEDYLGKFQTKNISFFRNGYQSWSTARSYRSSEKPLRPWLQWISLTTSNLANLPSNVPGMFNSDMYAVVSDLSGDESFLIGQASSFNQFFYITLNLFEKENLRSFFELTFDFGRKMLRPGERIELDGIIMTRGGTRELFDRYFERIREELGIVPKKRPKRGWSSWYYYFNRINPEILRENVRIIREKSIDVDFIQIDDGYQTAVGDWLTERPEFRGRMKELAGYIRDAGYIPGIWIAPFIADSSSELLRNHPEYLLRNEYGRGLLAGFAMFWKGRFFYGLDVTHPQFEEYIRNVIRTIVHDWGYRLLKVDFLFGACLRGGTYTDISMSRSEVLKKGLRIIREEAGNDVFIIGCGMPLSPGIGFVDAARVSPDTGPYWIFQSDKLFRTGAMSGVRNSVRNTLVRSAMHDRLWMNDPDCVMVRDRKTRLSPAERLYQINAAILSGGLLAYSDDMALLGPKVLDEIAKINALHDECSRGRVYTPDIMEQEMPEIVFNTSGYLGLFNYRGFSHDRSFDLAFLADPGPEPGTYDGIAGRIPEPIVLEDVWTAERIELPADGILTLRRMIRHSSRLFRLSARS